MTDQEIEKYNLSKLSDEQEIQDDPNLDLNYLRFKNHIKDAPPEEE